MLSVSEDAVFVEGSRFQAFSSTHQGSWLETREAPPAPDHVK